MHDISNLTNMSKYQDGLGNTSQRVYHNMMVPMYMMVLCSASISTIRDSSIPLTIIRPLSISSVYVLWLEVIKSLFSSLPHVPLKLSSWWLVRRPCPLGTRRRTLCVDRTLDQAIQSDYTFQQACVHWHRDEDVGQGPEEQTWPKTNKERIERNWLEHEITIFCTWTPNPMKKLKLNGKGTWETSEQSWVSTIPLTPCTVTPASCNSVWNLSDSIEDQLRWLLREKLVELCTCTSRIQTEHLNICWNRVQQLCGVLVYRVVWYRPSVRTVKLYREIWSCREIIRKVGIGMTCEVN